MSTSIDFTAGAAYVYLPGYNANCRSWLGLHTREVTDAVLVDLNPGMGPVGVEVLGLQAEIPIGRLVKEFAIPDETIRGLLAISSASMSVSGASTEEPNT